MAQAEISKIMWTAIAIALAASIFTIAKPEISTLSNDTFTTIETVVGSIGKKPPRADVPNETDSKWIVKENYGSNGRFVMDADGNAVVYAIDDSKPIKVSQYVSGLTSSNSKLVTLKYVDAVEITYSLKSFFSSDSNLRSIEGLNKFNTSNVTSTSAMFYKTALSSIDMSSFDLSRVTSIDSMFASTPNLKTIDLSPLKSAKLTSMNATFYNSGISDIKGLNLLNTSNVTSSSALFAAASNLTSIDISNWDLSNDRDISSMFMNTINLTLGGVKADNVIPTVNNDSLKSNNFSDGVKADVSTYLRNAIFSKS